MWDHYYSAASAAAINANSSQPAQPNDREPLNALMFKLTTVDVWRRRFTGFGPYLTDWNSF